ncbi:MAG: hypothetical protein EOO50_06365 [Flavobacterium sp.]|uniref:DUF6155 family protein n=1 Tax=Flavobacterium sp. TaxID=239 RepID=UPI0011FB083F|nr:DUF6155 family protein [Flavobacterium sp.]RZJ67364.1 MAG: hypothetical protein EOO50_06365 [Flavobacterium sp.]
MGKRDLKKYLAELDKEQISDQLLDLYDKFPEVKTYYDFVFKPNEEKLIGEAKAKISNEYFPIKSKRPKLRRSTAQKYIKHFLSLGVDSFAVADLMLYNIEVAQRYTAKREMRYSSFYKSMFNSYEQAVNFIIANSLLSDFRKRLQSIDAVVQSQNWDNRYDFEVVTENIEEM